MVKAVRSVTSYLAISERVHGCVLRAGASYKPYSMTADKIQLSVY